MPVIKPVITLDAQDLSCAMHKIWSEVPTSKAAPDGIVGIATGGLVCANILAKDLSLPMLEITLRRPSTTRKSHPLSKKALRLLPYAVSNWMRRFEDWKLERQTRRLSPGTNGGSTETNAVLAATIASVADRVRELELSHLVVIDDAVDSGITLGRVMSDLRTALPSQVRLTSAVVCQTRPNPSYVPDVALYHMCLCRFPWSFDFRGGTSRGKQ